MKRRAATKRQVAGLEQIVRATERLGLSDDEVALTQAQHQAIEAAEPQHGKVLATLLESWLTLTEAAALRYTSRPYVTAIANAGMLGPFEVAEDGRRRVQRSEVERYAAALVEASKGAMTPQQAGMAAGLYDFDG